LYTTFTSQQGPDLANYKDSQQNHFIYWMSTHNNRKLLDEVRKVMRLDHYSIHTERTYCDWIKQYIHFHKMKSRDDLQNGEAKIPEKAIRTA
jgi:hypothetical protein